MRHFFLYNVTKHPGLQFEISMYCSPFIDTRPQQENYPQKEGLESTLMNKLLKVDGILLDGMLL